MFSRLQGVNGNGRYQYWQAAVDANASAPWKGTGPGTFEFWWARHATTPGFVRDAHSLYFETLAETGIPGFALIVGLLALLLGVAAVRALRGPPGMRIWIAAAVGGLAAFMTSAAFEWVWEMGAIACAAMVLGAVIVAGRDAPAVDDEAPAPAPRSRQWPARAGVGLLAAVAIVAISIPLATALATRDSQQAAAEGRVAAALQHGRTAQRVQPYAATPRLQQALVLEQAGALPAALVAAEAATEDEPTNWRTWFTAARINARLGHAKAALADLRKARRLNPRSPLLGAR